MPSVPPSSKAASPLGRMTIFRSYYRCFARTIAIGSSGLLICDAPWLHIVSKDWLTVRNGITVISLCHQLENANFCFGKMVSKDVLRMNCRIFEVKFEDFLNDWYNEFKLLNCNMVMRLKIFYTLFIEFFGFVCHKT